MEQVEVGVIWQHMGILLSAIIPPQFALDICILWYTWQLVFSIHQALLNAPPEPAQLRSDFWRMIRVLVLLSVISGPLTNEEEVLDLGAAMCTSLLRGVGALTANVTCFIPKSPVVVQSCIKPYFEHVMSSANIAAVPSSRWHLGNTKGRQVVNEQCFLLLAKWMRWLHFVRQRIISGIFPTGNYLSGVHHGLQIAPRQIATFLWNMLLKAQDVFCRIGPASCSQMSAIISILSNLPKIASILLQGTSTLLQFIFTSNTVIASIIRIVLMPVGLTLILLYRMILGLAAASLDLAQFLNQLTSEMVVDWIFRTYNRSFRIVVSVAVCLSIFGLIAFAVIKIMEAHAARSIAASKRLIAKIRLRSRRIDKRYELEGCSICWANCAAGDLLIFLPCKHIYHTECLIIWLERRASCPLCTVHLEEADFDEARHTR